MPAQHEQPHNLPQQLHQHVETPYLNDAGGYRGIQVDSGASSSGYTGATELLKSRGVIIITNAEADVFLNRC